MEYPNSDQSDDDSNKYDDGDHKHYKRFFDHRDGGTSWSQHFRSSIQLSVQLRKSSWLNATTERPARSATWSYQLIFALVIAIVGTVIFSDRRTINAFNRIWSRLENFIEDCTNLLAAVSHDLRSPVTSLRLRAELQTIIETTLIFRTKKPEVSAPASQT